MNITIELKIPGCVPLHEKHLRSISRIAAEASEARLKELVSEYYATQCRATVIDIKEKL